MKQTLALLLLLLTTGGLLRAEQIPLASESGLKTWKKTIQGVTLEKGFVKIEPTAEDLVKGKGLLGIWRPVVLKKYAGKDVILSTDMMLKGLSVLRAEKYSGSKFMIHYRKDGKVIYRGMADRLGSAPWKTYEFRFKVPADGRFNVSLGMQAKGMICFRNLRIRPAEVFADFSSSANMGFADSKEKDGKGGWSDQGPDNDASGFDFRKSSYSGVPFHVTDPAKNNGKSVLTFGSVNFPKGLKTVRIPADPLSSASSLDEQLPSDDDNRSLVDVVPDPSSALAFENVERDIYTDQLRAALDKALAMLPEQQREVLPVRGPVDHPRLAAGDGILPVQVDAVQAVGGEEIHAALGKGLPPLGSGSHIREIGGVVPAAHG